MIFPGLPTRCPDSPAQNSRTIVRASGVCLLLCCCCFARYGGIRNTHTPRGAGKKAVEQERECACKFSSCCLYLCASTATAMATTATMRTITIRGRAISTAGKASTETPHAVRIVAAVVAVVYDSAISHKKKKL